MHVVTPDIASADALHRHGHACTTISEAKSYFDYEGKSAKGELGQLVVTFAAKLEQSFIPSARDGRYTVPAHLQDTDDFAIIAAPGDEPLYLDDTYAEPTPGQYEVAAQNIATLRPKNMAPADILERALRQSKRAAPKGHSIEGMHGCVLNELISLQVHPDEFEVAFPGKLYMRGRSALVLVTKDGEKVTHSPVIVAHELTHIQQCEQGVVGFKASSRNKEYVAARAASELEAYHNAAEIAYAYRSFYGGLSWDDRMHQHIDTIRQDHADREAPYSMNEPMLQNLAAAGLLGHVIGAKRYRKKWFK